eukprot:g2933.t1
MEGRLSVFCSRKRLCCFETRPSSDRTLIFLGGLTDGLLATPYIAPLAEVLDRDGWNVLQPILSSSYKGYGTSSLVQDCDELDTLIEWLCCHDSSSVAGKDVDEVEGVVGRESKNHVVVLMGHSTGCQISVAHAASGRQRELVRALILQAPVSDREYMATLPETAPHLAAAESMVAAGRGQELMPISADEAPISADRFVSLAARGGADDMFSSDMSNEELHARIGHVRSRRTPCIVLFSGADEYIPAEVDKVALAERLALALGGEHVVLDGADHAASTHVGQLVDHVQHFLLRAVDHKSPGSKKTHE